METSNLQHQICPQAIHSIYGPLEQTLGCPAVHQQQQQETIKPRPPPAAAEQPLSCPRCSSTNTKFCYYNNYSLAQPRYFCKGCRRYWTKGGSLRNVPVGGGCRKNKRSSSSSKKSAQDQNAPAGGGFGALLPSLPPPPPFVFDPHDLTLAFSTLHQGLDGHDDLVLGNPNPNPNPIPPQANTFLDILRSGLLDSGASAFDDLWYGFSGHHGSSEEAAEGGAGGSDPPATFEVQGGATAFPKQEPYWKSGDDGVNRLFMGLQWQVGGDGSVVVDPGRRDHRNGVSSSWHGLVNGLSLI